MFFATCIYAQSAEVITSILDSNEVTYGQVSYLSAVRRGLVSEKSSFEDALEVLANKGEVSADVKSDDLITMQDLAYIYTKIWPDISGSFMYMLTKGAPRYAFKLLKDDGIFSENTDPFGTVSGFDALNILSSCMIEYGASDECMTMEID